jgi:two-component system response regulator YesN
MYKILIVDDEPIVRKGICKMVPFHDLKISEVFQAENGAEALQIFKDNEIDICLLDINMPKMDGLEFAKQAKDIKKNVKIAFITGYDYFDYALQAIKVGADDYLLKPFSRKDVTALIKKIVSSLDEAKVAKEINSEEVKDFGYKREILDYFDELYLEEDFTLQVLAEHLGLSSGYLSGLFKSYFSEPFQDYLLRRRIEKAKVLLLSTDLRNYEIADQIGFSDPNYFSTRFKKQTGYSPKQYKEKVKS